MSDFGSILVFKYEQYIPQNIHILELSHSPLPPRSRTANKGDFGHVCVVGGNKGMGGAVRLAAEAALRVGSGLVSVATRPEYTSAILAARPEIMCHAIETTSDVDYLLEKATVILIGPGLGQDDWAQALYKRVLDIPVPKVLDADALNLLSQHPLRQTQWILTPHPGEAARLLNITPSDVQLDRYKAASALQKQYGGVIILKGAGSLIQTENGFPKICLAGNPGMASGGMGDVLGGVIAGLLAQKLSLEEAACRGTQIHALAADEAAKAGERGLLALDLMPFLRQYVN